MGVKADKRDLRAKIISYRYNMGTEDILAMLEEYEKLLKVEHTTDELAEAAFFRGQVSFHRGRYYDTVDALTKSIGMEKTKDYLYLETAARNLLGILFSFVGYESVALQNYLTAAEAAKKNHDVQSQGLVQLNIGILYQSLSDYQKAMDYFKRGYEFAVGDFSKPDFKLLLLCLIQRARLYCQMGRYRDAFCMKNDIESYYHMVMEGEFLLSKWILDIVLEEYFGTPDGQDTLILDVQSSLSRDENYLEQIDSYLELCSYLIEKNKRDQSRKMLDILREKLCATEFQYLRMRLEELEVCYQQKYGDRDQYLHTCLHYMEMQKEYEQTLKVFKRQNLVNIESLQEIEKQRMEFEIQSRRDLATGLFHKEAFQFEVELYLSERKRDIMDALLMIDIDDFKQVNDTFGHLVGDEVIAKLASLMKQQFQNTSICGRFGGDEFIIFICGIGDMCEVEKEIEQFREMFSELGFGKEKQIHNTVSIGVSYNSDINASYNTMLSCADEALLKVKEYGKNKVAYYEIKRGLLKYV